MDDSKDKVFQLNWLIGITRWGSIIQAVTYFILIWVFRLSLRAMRRNMKGQISLDDDEDDLLPFNFGILNIIIMQFSLFESLTVFRWRNQEEKNCCEY